MFFLLLVAIFSACLGSGVQNDIGWFKGCYKPVLQNATKLRILSYWNGPAHCTELCANSRQRYAAVKGSASCYCLQTLEWYQKVRSVECSFACTYATHLRCGGQKYVTIFDASVPVISNVSVITARHVNIANISRFSCHASLTVPWRQDGDLRSSANLSFSHRAPIERQHRSVKITWNINGQMVKFANKSIEEYTFNDTFHHKFIIGGIHSLCCNVSNAYSWLNKCVDVLGVESINTFRLVNIYGGQHIPDGLYAISQNKPFFVEVIINAGSFAMLRFDFGDDMPLENVELDYSRIKWNCSCFVLRRKLYAYAKRGVFSLNITAFNRLDSQSIVFAGKVVVEGIITGALIRTNFAAAGTRKRILVDVYGSFTNAKYEWTLENGEIRATEKPFIEISFSVVRSQYQLKVAVYNNVSRVETSKIIYIEPEIKGIMLALSSNISSVSSNVVLKATPNVDRVFFASSLRYKWELGDGQHFPGTLANFIYKYKTSGRFVTRVCAENFVSSACSGNVTVHIYEIITKVDITYKPFLFGEVSQLHASVADGSDVTYHWDFGDGINLATTNSTVFHNYTRLGNYSVKVTAKNPISFKEDFTQLFVMSYYCEKPIIFVSNTSYLEYVRVSSKVILDIDVRVNCSFTNKTIYKWKVFKVLNGERVLKSPLEIGASPLLFSERSLILPSNSLSPGKYVMELLVQMKDTIVNTRLHRIVNIIPSEIKAKIAGGKMILVSRKSHENVSLDASKSYDPDERNFTNFRYEWKCKSILSHGFGDCFKPNTTAGVNWTMPTFRFLPRILVTSSSFFAFIVTVSRDGVKPSRAVQFLEVHNRTVRRLHIDCTDCRGRDINTHKDIRLLGSCIDCRNSPMVFQWKVHFTPKMKVFLHHFGTCVPADGSAWRGSDHLNETNSTARSIIASATTVPPTTISTQSVITSVRPRIDETGFQMVICKSELDMLRRNWTNFEVRPRVRRDLARDLLLMKGYKKDSASNIWDDIDDEKDESLENDDEALDYGMSVVHRSKRDVNNSTDLSTTNNTADNSTDEVDNAADNSTIAIDTTQSSDLAGNNSTSILGGTGFSGTGSGQGNRNTGDTNGSVSGNSGFPSTSGSGRGQTTGGSGSGQGPSSSRGSGRGCDDSFGLTGAVAGSGGSGTTGGCSGNGDGFGDGARAHQNRTNGAQVNGTKKTDGSTSGNLVSADSTLLQDEIKLIKEIFSNNVLTKNAGPELDFNELLIKKNTMIPGQLYKVEFLAFWPNDSGRGRVAGRVSQYFLTNTGPFQGSCGISPLTGVEIRTVFSLECSHWKDTHHPLTFRVSYSSPTTHQKILLYSGLYARLKFTLPAGNSNSNNTINVEISIEDTENVKTELCPLKIQVFPTANDTSTVEQEVYRQVYGSSSFLTKYEDTSDKVAAVIFVSNIASTLNRLPEAPISSTSQTRREEIRTRLLHSISSFSILSEVFALQLSEIAREVVAKVREVSLKSAELSNTICDKLLSFHKSHAKDLSNDLSLALGRDLFAIVSSALSSTSGQKLNETNRHYVGGLAKQSLRVHGKVVEVLHRLGSHQTLRSAFLTTLLAPFNGSEASRTFSLNGTSFMLRDALELLFKNGTFGSNKVYSRFTVFKSDPFRWGRKYAKIDTRVASLDFLTDAGHVLNISNLTNPIEIILPVRGGLDDKAMRFSVNCSKMNIHQFNFTTLKRTLYIRVDDEDSNDSRGQYELSAVVSYDKEPTQRFYNSSLKFSGRKAVVRIPPLKDVSKIFIGIFLKKMGRVAKRKSVSRTYKLNVYTATCRFWDENAEVWSSQGCQTGALSTTSEIVCSCNHLTAFGGSAEGLEGKVRVISIVDFTRNADLHYLLATILVFVCLHLLLMAIFGIRRRPSGPYKNIAVLPDNHPADLFKYLVIAETGCSYNAGTTSRVSIVVYGEEGHSQIRELTCYNAEQFKRGSTNCVIMSFPDSLGDIKKIRLWHDNGGCSPDWFLKQLVIVDCQTDKKWYFQWNNWLAISENNTADCEILAKMKPSSNNMQTIVEGFLDYHLWISVFTSPASSTFSSLQRVLTSFTVSISYMTTAALLITHEERKAGEILGIWDIGHIALISSVFCSLVALPLQISIEVLFRNNMRRRCVRSSSDESAKSESRSLPDEDMSRSSGAIFFMELNSSIHSSQKFESRDEDRKPKVVQDYDGGESEMTYPLLPKWFHAMLVLLVLLLPASGISVTLLYCLRFEKDDVTLWMQILVFSILYSMFIIEIIKAFVLSIRRLYKLNRNEEINDFKKLLSTFQASDESTRRDNFSEKEIMAARARARFVRFSRPILGKELRKARRKSIPIRNLLSFMWHAATSLILLVTLCTILSNSNSNQKFYRSQAVRNMVNSCSRSLKNVSTVERFWDWTEHCLVDLLVWGNWHHIHAKFKETSTFSDEIYTLGPGRLKKKDREQRKDNVTFNRSSSDATAFNDQILLVGEKSVMVKILHKLQALHWVSNATSSVKVSFVYFHPETNLFSNVDILVHISEVGSLDAIMQVESILLSPKWSSSNIYVVSMQIICFLLVVVLFRNEFSVLLDKGIGHLRCGWSILEGLLILFTVLAAISLVLSYIITKQALYQVDLMELSDSTRFLDLSRVIFYKKMLLFVHATLLFLVILRSMKLLLVWKRFAIIFWMLRGTYSSIMAILVIIAVVIFALSHMGVLIFVSTSQCFARVDIAWMTLWTNVNRSYRHYIKEFVTDVSISPIFGVFSGLSLFALWRISAVLFFGRFIEAKSMRYRQMCLLKTLKLRLRKLRSKKVWLHIISSVWNKFFRKQSDQYKVCNLPLENVYEEIEYQVEEVLFRLNNLFDMDDRHEKIGEDEDELTLDSSEEAAYPSSYSTKDSISFTSESLYSDDSGYYRFGEYVGRRPSASNSESEYEGPIIHRLEPPRRRFKDLGQKLIPIFGGRYFVKTSMGTFRAPKIQPGPVKLEPPPKVLPPIRKRIGTFEKLSNWSATSSVVEPVGGTPADLFNVPSSSIEPNYFENESNVDEKRSTEVTPPSTNLPVVLPKAMHSLAHKMNAVPWLDARKNPIQLPPSMAELKAKARKCYKRSQIAPMRLERQHSLSSSTKSSVAGEILPFGENVSVEIPGRCSSIDSGVMQSSGIEDYLTDYHWI